jgi:hypothetical protein
MPILQTFGNAAARAFGFTRGSSAASYELISTTVLGSTTSSVSFSSIPAGYKHLQIRYTVRHADSTAGVPDLLMRFNGDSASNYSYHGLYGAGSSVASFGGATQAQMIVGQVPKNSETSTAFHVGVVDILDAFSTTNYKTVRSLHGRAQTTNFVALYSGNYRSTSAISSITLLPDAGSGFITNSRFSLYGVRG